MSNSTIPTITGVPQLGNLVTTNGEVNTSLISKVSSVIANFFGLPSASQSLRPLAVPSETTSTGASDIAVATFNNIPINVARDRKKIYFELKQMGDMDDLVDTALDIYADCVTGYDPDDKDGFEWEFATTQADSENNTKVKEALKILLDAKSRLDLGTECWKIVRNFIQYGEEYREVVIDDEGNVVRFKFLPSYQVWPNFDKFGNKLPGWEQRLDGIRPNSGIKFAEWQIIPFIFGSTESYFGKGLMTSSRRTWRRLQKLEDGMVIARLVRAYDKYLHKVPVGGNWMPEKIEETIKNYRDNMVKKKFNTGNGTQYLDEYDFNVETDFFMAEDGLKRGDIVPLRGENKQLSSLEDIEYLRDRLLARTKVPRHYMNLGTGNKNALTEGGTSAEDIQFGRTLRQGQAILRRGIFELGAFILFLKGYDAHELGLKIVMTKVNTDQFLQDSQIKYNLAQCAQIYAVLFGGLPIEIIAKSFMLLDTEQQAILKEWTESAGVDNGILPGAQPKEPAVGSGNTSSNPTSINHPNNKGKVSKTSKTSGVAKGGSGTTPRTQDISEALTSLQLLVQEFGNKSGIPINNMNPETMRNFTNQVMLEVIS